MSPTPTPDWYSTHAAAFCARTFVIDMEDARTRFLRHLPAGGRILDVGCGSGRDSKRFAELGYAVDARDRSHEIANEAARRTGLAVRVEDVLAMEDRASFDGIWASAMLIHLDDADFDEAVRRLAAPCGREAFSTSRSRSRIAWMWTTAAPSASGVPKNQAGASARAGCSGSSKSGVWRTVRRRKRAGSTRSRGASSISGDDDGPRGQQARTAPPRLAPEQRRPRRRTSC